MTLETGVKALAEAVAVDVKAIEDGKVDKELGKGLSDTNYTQVEKTKLAGVALEATKNRADSENADKVHTHTMAQVVGLGTAATYDVGESTGQVMQVGAFGTGLTFSSEILDANAIANQVGNKSGFYPHVSNIGSANVPYTFVYIQQLFYEDGNLTQIAYGYNIPEVWVRHRYDGDWSSWAKQLSTNDILQTTGTSTEFPMSQGAVTDALDTKAALNATATQQGGLKARLDGTTLYLTNDGTNP